jgi:hypothetical protein
LKRVGANSVRDDDEGRFRFLALKLSQCSQFVAVDRMRGRLPALDPADMQHRHVEVESKTIRSPTQPAGW